MEAKLRTQFLESKCLEVESELRQWAEEIGLLGGGEQLRFTIEVKTFPVVTGVVVEPDPTRQINHSYKGNRGMFLSERVTEEEWQIIHSHFAGHSMHLEILQLLRNNSLRNSEIGKRLRLNLATHQVFSRISAINGIFRDTPTLQKFRIRSIQGARSLYRVQ